MIEQQLSLHSEMAIRLIHGRKPEKSYNHFPINGLIQFATKANILWKDAAKDNPFAQWYLIRCDRRFEAVQYAFKTCQEWLDKVSNDGGYDYQPALSASNAQTFAVDLANPYVKHACRLLKSFDGFVMYSHKLNQVGLITRDECYKVNREINRQLVAIFHLASRYMSANVTRENLSSLSEVQHSAIKRMGIVPPLIVSGDIQPRFMPSL